MVSTGSMTPPCSTGVCHWQVSRCVLLAVLVDQGGRLHLIQTGKFSKSLLSGLVVGRSCIDLIAKETKTNAPLIHAEAGMPSALPSMPIDALEPRCFVLRFSKLIAKILLMRACAEVAS